MKKHIYFLVLMPAILAFTLHKFHLSNTKVVFNKKQESIQITMRCFVDDIENDINKINNIAIELGTDRELKQADKYTEQYIEDNFNIWINTNSYTYTYIGKEVEKDLIYFYLEIDSIKNVHNIKIENTILLKKFDDQQNIIRLDVNNKKKTFLLKNNKNYDDYTFN